jgi:hypothetical protein
MAMTTFRKDASLAKSLVAIARWLLFVPVLLAMNFWLLHFPILSFWAGAAASIVIVSLIYVFRNSWGDTVTITNHSISIEKGGKQRIEIAHSGIKNTIAKSDSLILLWEANNQSGSLFIAKEGFSESTWNQFMQCMETSLNIAGTELSVSKMNLPNPPA